MIIRKLLTLVALSIVISHTTPTFAEGGEMSHTIEFQASASNNKTPLWLNANKYGLSSLNRYNAYARGICSYQNSFDAWNIDYQICGDLVLPFLFKYTGYNGSEYSSSIILQQLYAEFKWRNILLTVGSKQQPMKLRDNALSSGAQTLGINSRPIPQGRIQTSDWWVIPGFKQWLAFQGHIAYGIMSDANWEESFVGLSGNKYNRWTRYHEKAGFLRVGNTEKYPLYVTVGLEMAAQFGGSLCNFRGTDQIGYRSNYDISLNSGIKDYWNAFIPGGGDTGETQFENAEGNHLGSWLVRLDWKRENYAIGFYWDHFFEDHSGMFHLDYDGYGSGTDWNTKKKFRFFAYDFKDGQFGMDVKFANGTWLQKMVLEFINTKYQSGPVYHDHNSGNPDHIGGNDNYYNHYSQPGWQHWGQVIGNPLYRSPMYNKNGFIGIESNRFTAWHLGLSGTLPFIRDFNYRMLVSWQKAFGTYDIPFIHPRENVSGMFEISLVPFKAIKQLKLKGAIGFDTGRIYDRNAGVQFTMQYNL